MTGPKKLLISYRMQPATNPGSAALMMSLDVMPTFSHSLTIDDPAHPHPVTGGSHQSVIE